MSKLDSTEVQADFAYRYRASSQPNGAFEAGDLSLRNCPVAGAKVASGFVSSSHLPLSSFMIALILNYQAQPVPQS